MGASPQNCFCPWVPILPCNSVRLGFDLIWATLAVRELNCPFRFAEYRIGFGRMELSAVLGHARPGTRWHAGLLVSPSGKPGSARQQSLRQAGKRRTAHGAAALS